MTWIIEQIALPCLLNLSDTKCAKVMRFNRNTVLKATLWVILVHFFYSIFIICNFVQNRSLSLSFLASHLSSGKRVWGF